MKKLKELLKPADLSQIVCIDERKTKEKLATNPVKLPGATESLVDALKTLYGYNEDQAFYTLSTAGIALGAHEDDHHGYLGCGYARLVEQNPKAVWAFESVTAESRMVRVVGGGGVVLHYQGKHKPKIAVINQRIGESVPQEMLWPNRMFWCDVWAAEEYGERLKKIDQRINPKVLANHIEKVFKLTVTTLTNGRINNFVVIK